MQMGQQASTIEELWEQAEEALEASSKRAEGLLTQLVSAAEEGSDASLFAHRHLAELRLEDNPWKAALHLRRVLVYCAEDDGHLMDVALDDPTGAERHLRRAYELEPEHDEIIGSLAHCVARLGALEEAQKLAGLAQEKGPCNPDHRALLEWIEGGATDAPAATATVRRPPGDRVAETVQRKMGEAGFSRAEIERATQLWSDMQAHCELRVTKPEVLAAALEYAIAVVEQRPGCTQAEVARRYGVAPTSVSARFAQIRNALALRPGDPRYAASR
jgi:hypothetical protein